MRFFLSSQKYVRNFFSVLEKENKKVKLEDVKKMVKENMMLLLLFYLQKKRKKLNKEENVSFEVEF